MLYFARNFFNFRFHVDFCVSILTLILMCFSWCVHRNWRYFCTEFNELVHASTSMLQIFYTESMPKRQCIYIRMVNINIGFYCTLDAMRQCSLITYYRFRWTWYLQYTSTAFSHFPIWGSSGSKSENKYLININKWKYDKQHHIRVKSSSVGWTWKFVLYVHITRVNYDTMTYVLTFSLRQEML